MFQFRYYSSFHLYEGQYPVLLHFESPIVYAPWVWCGLYMCCMYSLGILRNYPVWSTVRSLDLSGNLSYTLLGPCLLICTLSLLSLLSPCVWVSSVSLNHCLSISGNLYLSNFLSLRLCACLSLLSFLSLSLSLSPTESLSVCRKHPYICHLKENRTRYGHGKGDLLCHIP